MRICRGTETLDTTGRSSVLGLSIFLFLSTAVAAGVQSERLPRQLKWLAEGADPAYELTHAPAECINPEADALAILGRLAFNSSALLGGQAAHMGLSCASCHPSARTNTSFFIRDISGAPGTADVTHSFFSSTGGNQDFNPTPIPDLAIIKSMTIPDRQADEFRAKIIQLVEVEFDGQPSLPMVLDALQEYLLNIDTKHCSDEHAVVSRTLDQDWQALQSALKIIETNLSQPELVSFVVRIARQQLETIYRRYGLRENSKLDRLLIASSRQLANIAEAEPLTQKRRILEKWNSDAATLHTLLKKAEPKSAYRESVLREYLTQASD